MYGWIDPSYRSFFQMWFRITVLGKGAHGGTRYEGVSAIDNAYDVLRRLRILEQQRTNVLRHDPFYSKIPIPVPISVGKIHGGEWPSSVPDHVTLEGRMGISPYETVDEAKDALRSAISSFSSDENEVLSFYFYMIFLMLLPALSSSISFRYFFLVSDFLLIRGTHSLN